MPADLFGLPTHILLLHIVIVLLPIVAAATVVVALSGRFRRRWGIATVIVTFGVSLFVPLTTQAGESLAERLPDTPSITRHADIGNQLVIWTAVFGLSLFAVVAIDLARRASAAPQELTPTETWTTGRPPRSWRAAPPRWAAMTFRVAQILALVTSVGVTVMVILAGHTGARAVWANFPNLK
jgi:Predicted membrane protein (DUF2231)